MHTISVGQLLIRCCNIEVYIHASPGPRGTYQQRNDNIATSELPWELGNFTPELHDIAGPTAVPASVACQKIHSFADNLLQEAKACRTTFVERARKRGRGTRDVHAVANLTVSHRHDSRLRWQTQTFHGAHQAVYCNLLMLTNKVKAVRAKI